MAVLSRPAPASRVPTYTAHPLTEIFPPPTEEEFEGIKADIAANGQIDPVVLYEGRVLDGRTRMRACKELGLVPRTEALPEVADPIAYIVSRNWHRRHLTASQRATVAVAIEEAYARQAKARMAAGGGDKRSERSKRAAGPVAGVEIIPHPVADPQPRGKSRDQAGAVAGVSGRYVSDAKALKAQAPEIFARVQGGEVSIPNAIAELRRREKAQAVARRATTAEAKGPTDSRVVWGDNRYHLPRRRAESVDLVLTDPPYNQGEDYGTGQRADRLSEADYLLLGYEAIKECARLLKPTGSLWVVISNNWLLKWGAIVEKAGLHVRGLITWHETFGVYNSRETNFGKCSRHLIYAVKDPEHYTFNPEAVRSPSARQQVYGDKRANPDGKVWDDVWRIPRLTDNSKERWASSKRAKVPNQLPLALVVPIVLCSSHAGDTVLDPFSGSATVGVAALAHARHYLGVEIVERNAADSEDRLRDPEHRKLAVAAADRAKLLMAATPPPKEGTEE